MAPKTEEIAEGTRKTEDGIEYEYVFGQWTAVAAGNGWEDVALDEGEQIDFEREPLFVGKFLGTKIVPDLEGINGEKRDVTLLLLEDKDGKRRSVWAGYVLENAVTVFNPNDGILIEYAGKKSFGKNGQTMQAFNVRRKPATR